MFGICLGVESRTAAAGSDVPVDVCSFETSVVQYTDNRPIINRIEVPFPQNVVACDEGQNQPNSHILNGLQLEFPRFVVKESEAASKERRCRLVTNFPQLIHRHRSRREEEEESIRLRRAHRSLQLGTARNEQVSVYSLGALRFVIARSRRLGG